MKVGIAIITLPWAASVLTGGFMLWRHQWTPGHAAAKAPAQLSGPTKGGARLVVFLHPQCPCSHATVEELNRIMTAAGAAVHADLFFYRPRTQTDSWCRTALWREAAELPHTTLLQDTDGIEATRFGAHTSGQTLLYSDKGALVFSGGITPGRAHEGDNVGEETIIAYLRSRRVRAASTPVYGCAIR